MSAWVIYVACYLLVGFAITEIGVYGYRKRGSTLPWWLYLIGTFLWPVVILVMFRPKSNK